MKKPIKLVKTVIPWKKNNSLPSTENLPFQGENIQIFDLIFHRVFLF